MDRIEALERKVDDLADTVECILRGLAASQAIWREVTNLPVIGTQQEPQEGLGGRQVAANDQP